MAFNNAIPAMGESGPQAQVNLLANMQAIDTVNLVNHVDFNDADQGKHKFLQLPEQAVTPATAANEGALYCKVSPSSAVTALFFRDESSGDEVEITGAGKTADGWAYLPSGLFVFWGSTLVNADTDDTMTFAAGAGIPALTSVFSAQLTKEGDLNGTGAVYLQTLTTTNVTVYNRGSKDVIHYLVIGV